VGVSSEQKKRRRFRGHRDLPAQAVQGHRSGSNAQHAEGLEHLMERFTGYLKVHSSMEHFRAKLFVVEVNRMRIRE
jgi:hypothetical protein